MFWTSATRPACGRAVVLGAHIPAPPASERVLHQRGVLQVPDFIANAGGVICAALEYHGATQAAAFQAIEERIRANTDQVRPAPGSPRRRTRCRARGGGLHALPAAAVEADRPH